MRQIKKHARHARIKYPLSSDNINPPHVGYQRLRHTNAAIRLLIIFDNSYQCAPHSQARAVQSVHQLRLAALRIAEAGLHAAGLKVGAVGAGRNFTKLVLTRYPDLNVIGFTGRKARSEERRVGKECISRRWPYQEKKKKGT